MNNKRMKKKSKKMEKIRGYYFSILVSAVCLCSLFLYKSNHHYFDNYKSATATAAAAESFQHSTKSQKIVSTITPGGGVVVVAAVPPPPDVSCQWIVLAGDSNTRMGYYAWADLELSKNHSTVLQAQWIKSTTATATATATPVAKVHIDTASQNTISTKGNTLPCSESTWRWVDKEMVLLSHHHQHQHPRNCRIVTLKFLTNQNSEVTRLSNFLQHSSHYCPGYELEQVLPAGYARPKQPSAIWLSHGLWGLPNQGSSANVRALNCTQRFQPHIEMLAMWMKDQTIPSVHWQTLFPINGHPTVTNQYLEWDYKCQLQQAQQYQLDKTIVDWYKWVGPDKAHLLRPGDAHFQNNTKLVEHYLEKCCGGWDSYWTNP